MQPTHVSAGERQAQLLCPRQRLDHKNDKNQRKRFEKCFKVLERGMPRFLCLLEELVRVWLSLPLPGPRLCKHHEEWSCCRPMGAGDPPNYGG